MATHPKLPAWLATRRHNYSDLSSILTFNWNIQWINIAIAS